MNWTVSRRIATGFAISLALMLVIAAIGMYALARSERAYSAALAQQQGVLVPALRAENDFRQANLMYLFYLLDPEDRWAVARDSALRAATASVRRLADSASESRETWGEAATLLGRIDAPMQRAMAAAGAGRLTDALRIRDVEIAPIRDGLYRVIGSGIRVAEQRTAAITGSARRAAARMQWVLGLGSILALLAGIASAIFLSRAVTGPLQKTSAVLATSAAEILASTTQQAASATETSAAVTETVTTVDEVAQTAEHAAERARAVSDLAQRAAEISRTGRLAVEHSVSGMDEIKKQVESISSGIVALAGHAQAIGEITATVSEIAEQTNLLALNAAVEAARAGEHGRGFAVVAAEVRSLADEAKKATVQVRQILGEIQRATTSAVSTTEQGMRQVSVGAAQIAEGGDTIRLLADAVTEASQAAAQIVASAAQQAAGMSQIRQAMANVHEATQQNLAATRQAENAARDLNSLGGELLDLVGSNGQRDGRLIRA